MVIFGNGRVVCESRDEIKIAKLHFTSCPGGVVAGVDETTESENI